MNPIHIIEGHANKLLDKAGLLPEDLKRLSELRMTICKQCHATNHPTKPSEYGPGLLNGKYCDSSKGGCGCDMEAKTKVLAAKCPIGRW